MKYLYTTLQAHLIITGKMVLQKVGQTCQSLLYKAKESGDKPYFVLMLYRSTLHGHDLPSTMCYIKFF